MLFLLFTALTAIGFITSIHGVHAVTPGNNALNEGLPDEIEQKLFEKVGQEVFDGLASETCKINKCILSVPTFPCIQKCVEDGEPSRLSSCLSTARLCSCVECLPTSAKAFVIAHDVCADDLGKGEHREEENKEEHRDEL
ncbi:hypothetical protein ONZ45_g6015 [Pleurotus djamor]|nr:hypothetical protein ONZ45_g10218 [Pleurotus djamor]KAJ8516703.1 hypothetical protein ONZ45_g6015 [Pleurotus djamor]